MAEKTFKLQEALQALDDKEFEVKMQVVRDSGQFDDVQVASMLNLRRPGGTPENVEEASLDFLGKGFTKFMRGDIMAGGGTSMALAGLGAVAAGPPGMFVGGAIGTGIEKFIQEDKDDVDVFGFQSDLPPSAAAMLEIGGEALLGQVPNMLKTGKKGAGIIKRMLSNALKGTDDAIIREIELIERVGKTKIPIALAQEGIGNTLTKTLAEIDIAGNLKATLQKDTSTAIKNAFFNAYKLNPLSKETRQGIVDGFNSGVAMAHRLGNGEALNPSEVLNIRNISKVKRTFSKMRSQIAAAENVLNKSSAVIKIGEQTKSAMRKSLAAFDALNVSLNPQMKKQFQNLIKIQARLQSNVVQAGVKKEKGSFLRFFNDIDSLHVEAVRGVSNETAQKVNRQLDNVKNALRNDIIEGLPEEQLKVFTKWEDNIAAINAPEASLFNAINAGESIGVMQRVLKDPVAAKVFKDSIGASDAREFGMTYLFEIGTRADGSIDFVKMANKLADPSQRAGLRTLVGGSDPLQLLRNFANVAKNTSVSKAQRNFMFYNLAMGGAGFLLRRPIAAAAGLAFTITNKGFLDKLLFDRTLGRLTAEATKMPVGSREARRAGLKFFTALNGVEIIIHQIDEDGNSISSEPGILRGVDKNGDPFIEESPSVHQGIQ